MNKPKRLKDFDFSVKGAHVALVDKAANGKEQFLTVKNYNDEMISYHQVELDRIAANKVVIDKAKEVVVEMPLLTVLCDYLYMNENTAARLVSAIKSATSGDDSIMQRIQSDLIAMNSVGASGASDNGGISASFLIAKSKEEAPMSIPENAPDTIEVQELLKNLQAQNEVIKALHERVEAAQVVELARESARYVEITKKYESLGLQAEDAGVVQELAKLTGSEKIMKALDTALDLVANLDKLESVGQGGSNDNTSVKTELELKAKEIAEKEGLSIPQATVKAIDLFPHLIK